MECLDWRSRCSEGKSCVRGQEAQRGAGTDLVGWRWGPRTHARVHNVESTGGDWCWRRPARRIGGLTRGGAGCYSQVQRRRTRQRDVGRRNERYLLRRRGHRRRAQHPWRLLRGDRVLDGIRCRERGSYLSGADDDGACVPGRGGKECWCLQGIHRCA